MVAHRIARESLQVDLLRLIGALTPRGERKVLIVSMDTLLRISFNSFFPYLLGIEEGITGHFSDAIAEVTLPR